MTALLDGDLIVLGDHQHALVQGYPDAAPSTSGSIVVRPWYVDDLHGRRPFARHTAVDPAPFRRALVLAGMMHPPVRHSVLPFCVSVRRDDIRRVPPLSLRDAVERGRIRPTGWTLAELGQILGRPADDLSVTGSVLAGSPTSNDIDIFLPDRIAAAALRDRSPDTDRDRDRDLLHAQRSYFVNVDVDVHALLTARSSWRRLRLGDQDVDLIPRYAADEGSPVHGWQVGPGDPTARRLLIGPSPDDLFFPAVHECADGCLLVTFSRLLQGTLRTGDRLWVGGRDGEITYRGQRRAAVFVTESDPIHRLVPHGGSR